MYTQFGFNNLGLNPAASGLDINRKNYIMFGFNQPWANLENAPRQQFFSYSQVIRHPRIVSYWQSAGLYIDNDQGGLIGSMGAYGTYAFHFLVKKKTILSFGAFLGARRFARSLGNFDPNDPAVSSSASDVFTMPDFIPGFRITHRRFYSGISLRQITLTRMKDFKGNRIGSPGMSLKPNIYIDYGRFVPVADQVLFMPSVALNIPVLGIPAADFNMMFYFGNRLGTGVALRNLASFSGIVQLRFLGNMTVGFAYSYPINEMRYTNARNSFEVMIGVIPMGMDVPTNPTRSVARCPSLNY
jgi:type IX secretion system PorP/SprF family membrane protein